MVVANAWAMVEDSDGGTISEAKTMKMNLGVMTVGRGGGLQSD